MSSEADKIDFSNPDLKSLFKELCDEKSSLTWVAYGFSGENSLALEVVDKGDDGFAELKKKMSNEWNRKILFGCFKVIALDHRGTTTSKRVKLVSYSFIGTNVEELLRARTSFQKGKVLPALFPATHLSLEINQRDVGDITENSIAKQLHSATAAHKPTHYLFLGKNAKQLDIEQIIKKDESDDENSDFSD